MFVDSIIFLIISPNVSSILFGWDGLGLVSYFLAIYCHSVSSYGACMLTVLSHRIGDVALLMVIAWIINFSSSFLSKSTLQLLLAAISVRKLMLS
jgi:NADH-ubiquinone oxidoreductase chain 5